MYTDYLRPTIDLTDFTFHSDNHIRLTQGIPSGKDNKGARRSVWIESTNNMVFSVTIHAHNGSSPLLGSMQMSEKQMKAISEDDDKIVLRGFGHDGEGYPFSDYGMTLFKKRDGSIHQVVLHLLDRGVDILYL